MGWSAERCLAQFEDLVRQTFGRRRRAHTLLGQAFEYLTAYRDDHRYPASPIQAAFTSATGTPARLFNPLSCGTKVGVITAPVRSKTTSVICNYNGEPRPDSLGYQIMRHRDRRRDVTVGEA